jgi:hypothetical protein
VRVKRLKGEVVSISFLTILCPIAVPMPQSSSSSTSRVNPTLRIKSKNSSALQTAHDAFLPWWGQL